MILKRVSDGNGITSNSKQQLNSILCIISALMSNRVRDLTEVAKKRTISAKEVESAIVTILPEELANNAVRAARRAVTRSLADTTLSGRRRQDRAGIVFPPSITEKFLRDFGNSKLMVTVQAPIQLAAVVEYLASEILENAAVSAKDKKRVRVTVRDLEVGVRNDRAIDQFFVNAGITFLGGGVVPYVHPQLLTRKGRSRGSIGNGSGYHRYRPGTVSVREIKHFQQFGDCLMLAKAPFEKLVRSIVSNQNQKCFKISKDVPTILQYFVEQQIVELLRNANAVAVHAGRVKLMNSDISLIRSISSGILWQRKVEVRPDLFGLGDTTLPCSDDGSASVCYINDLKVDAPCNQNVDGQQT